MGFWGIRARNNITSESEVVQGGVVWCDVSCACGCGCGCGWVLCCAVLSCAAVCCVGLGCVGLCCVVCVVARGACVGGGRWRVADARLGLAGSAPAMPRTSHDDPARDPFPISRIRTTDELQPRNATQHQTPGCRSESRIRCVERRVVLAHATSSFWSAECFWPWNLN